MNEWNPVEPPDRAGDGWTTWCNGHPVARGLGMTVVSWDEGQMTYAVPSASYLNPNGAYHGGLLAACLDHALATTVMLGMPADALPNTVKIDVEFLRPALPELSLRAKVTRSGRSLVFAHADGSPARSSCARRPGVFHRHDPEAAHAWSMSRPGIRSVSS